MKILASNDDGVHATGLKTLVEHISGIAEVMTVAPDRNRSGASNSLTLEDPLRVRRMSKTVYSVNGTPTDCVHLAITGLLDFAPNMVVSGINHGANLGDDVLYSGTVAAAMEGRFLGLPALAISQTGGPPFAFETAARVAVDVVRRLASHKLAADTILNVNVPNLPHDQLRGMRVCRLGHRHQAEEVIRREDPRGKPIYWIGPAGKEADSGPGTDFHAINEGYVSITPLTVDLTARERMDELASWLERPDE
ncbi:MAG: 5'/3'-nucleotidase SurE [Gammaproteobacteria bacterium]